MKLLKLLLVPISIIFMALGCSSGISGKVVDADTGKPIEDAVVLVEWTTKKGSQGLYHTESLRVVEKLTDKEGNFKISGVIGSTVEAPDITVYKKGYIAWNSKYIFPDYRRREDFQWRNNLLIRISHFDESKYTHLDHVSFIHGCINYGLPGSEKRLIEAAIRWEQIQSMKKQPTPK